MSATSRPSFAWPFAAFAMLAALLVPSLWNGFPFIFPDTGGYLARPVEGTLGLGRSAFYGAFLLFGQALDFWPNVVVQAALTVWLVVLTLRCHGLGDRPQLALGVMLLLAIGTSAPWFAGQLMPDIFVAAAVLAMHLLAFRLENLSTLERAALLAVIAASIASHMAILALCAGMVIALLLLKAMRNRLLRPRLSAVKFALACGIALALVSNFVIAGKFAFTPGGESFLFGRLVQDGIVARYLHERCPDPSIRLCEYKTDLPAIADDWLWEAGTPFNKLGGWKDYAPEERRIILDTILLYPGLHAVTAVQATLTQLTLFKTEVSLNPWHNVPAVGMLQELAPAVMPHLRAARQQEKPFDLEVLNYLHVPLAALAMIGLISALVFSRRLHVKPETAALSFSVLSALLINAAISGGFSNPVDRYQSRLAWLAVLAAAIAALAAMQKTARKPLAGHSADLE